MKNWRNSKKDMLDLVIFDLDQWFKYSVKITFFFSMKA